MKSSDKRNCSSFILAFIKSYPFVFLSAICGVVLTILLCFLSTWLSVVLTIVFTFQISFLMAWLERIGKVVISTPDEVRVALSRRLHDCFSAFNPKFDMITQYLIREKYEIHSHVVNFVERSLKKILDQGFAEARVEFPSYQSEAIGFVRSLYESKQRDDIWTVCLYCPLEYLFMWVDRRDHKNKAGHLPIFDGVMSEDQSVTPLTRRETDTHFVRVVYLEEDRIHSFLDPQTPIHLESKYNPEALAYATAFAFLWFLFYNRLIDLFWAWSDIMPYTGSSRSLAEDFMIFNGHQFLRYDKKYKNLLLCWNPTTDLFSEAKTMFDEASKLFQALTSTSTPTTAEDRQYFALVKRQHRKELFSLFRNRGHIIAKDDQILSRVRNVFLGTLTMISNSPNWPNTGDAEEAKGRDLFIQAVSSVKNALGQNEDSFKKMELTMREHLNNLAQQQPDLISLYNFLDSNYFVSSVKKIFPVLADDDLKCEIVSGINEWPEEANP